jgi:hypothetical protein
MCIVFPVSCSCFVLVSSLCESYCVSLTGSYCVSLTPRLTPRLTRRLADHLWAIDSIGICKILTKQEHQGSNQGSVLVSR